MDKVNLLIMRHGEAVGRAKTDFERDLSPYGQEQVKKAAERLFERNCRVEQIIASPLNRAQQTGQIVASALGVQGPLLTSEFLTPESAPEHFLHQLGDTLAARPCLIVTHQPFVSLLIHYLTATSVSMGTATVAGLSMSHFSEGSGEVAWVNEG